MCVHDLSTWQKRDINTLYSLSTFLSLAAIPIASWFPTDWCDSIGPSTVLATTALQLPIRQVSNGSAQSRKTLYKFSLPSVRSQDQETKTAGAYECVAYLKWTIRIVNTERKLIVVVRTSRKVYFRLPLFNLTVWLRFYFFIVILCNSCIGLLPLLWCMTCLYDKQQFRTTYKIVIWKFSPD